MSSPTVFVVDDDAAVRDSLSLLLETAGLPAEAYASAEAFLAALHSDRSGCIVLDVRMPGMAGPALQTELARRGVRLPIIFLTAHGDVPTSVQAMKAGAVDFLTKPVNGALLLDRVHAAMERNAEERQRETAQRALRERLTGLTEREREILALAVAGQPNKEIARQLGISYRTVEVHRSRILLKTGAGSLIELARLATACGLDISRHDPLGSDAR